MNELREEIERVLLQITPEDLKKAKDDEIARGGEKGVSLNSRAAIYSLDRQLKSSLAANRAHERQFSDIQDSIVATFKDFERASPEHFASQLRFVCSYYRGAMDTINALDAAKKELEAANREQKAQLLDRDNHIDLAYKALGDVNRSVYLFDHIREQKAEIERLKEQLNAANSACEEGGEIVGELASVGEKWIDVKQELPPIDEGGDTSEILMGSYGSGWDLVRLHRKKGWITLPGWDKARNPIISWHRLPAPPTVPGEEK